MKININIDTYLELEKISNGSFYPLKGFMEEKDFYSVCHNFRLFNGRLFPMPILLPISKIQAESNFNHSYKVKCQMYQRFEATRSATGV